MTCLHSKLRSTFGRVSSIVVAMAFTALTTVSPHLLAQETTPELDAWLKANQLGSYADGNENWDEIVAKARQEGEVVVYSSSGRIAKLVDSFKFAVGLYRNRALEEAK